MRIQLSSISSYLGSAIWQTVLPLTAATAQIPALVPAQGTQEASEIWNLYSSRCMEEALAAQVTSIKSAITDSQQPTAPQSAEVVEEKIRKELKIPKLDPLLQPLVQLFERGDLVTIDKGSRIPPLEVPIKAEWFGIPSFREVGVVSREVRYKISVLDERTNKALDARRKDTSGSTPEILISPGRRITLDASQRQEYVRS